MSIKKVLRIVRNLILFFFISTILAVVLYRFIPVYTTPLMVIRSTQQLFKAKSGMASYFGFLSIRSPLTCQWQLSLRKIIALPPTTASISKR